MKKRLLSVLALTVALSAISITAHAAEVPVYFYDGKTTYYGDEARTKIEANAPSAASKGWTQYYDGTTYGLNGRPIATTVVNPAVYELNYTADEIAYLNKYNPTYKHWEGGYLIFNNQSSKEYESNYVDDSRRILQGVGLDIIWREGLQPSEMETGVLITWVGILDGTGESSTAYEVCSPLTRYSNNVIVAEISESPYYRTIVEIRYDMNNNYVTHRVRENPDAISEVTLTITKFPNEDPAYTENEMKYLAEDKAIYGSSLWSDVDDSGRYGGGAEDHFDVTNPDYTANVLFSAQCFLSDRYGCDTGKSHIARIDYDPASHLSIVDTWVENEMTMHALRSSMIPGKEFILRIDYNLRCVTMRARDI